MGNNSTRNLPLHVASNKSIPLIQSPASLLALLSMVIFIAELVAVNFVHVITHEHPYAQMGAFLLQSFLNVFILIVLISPALYFFIYRPLIVNLDVRNKTEKYLVKLIGEKEMLVREVYHRVKNNLMVVQSLLRLQSKYIEDKEAKEYFNESMNRIKSLSIIHERLYRAEDLKQINLSEYITSLARRLFNSYNVNSDNVKLVLDVPEVTLDADTMIQCGLILNELVSNALKHAFANNGDEKLTIKVLNEGNKYTLLIKDNGHGIPDGIDIFNTESMGMQIVMASIKQLGGTIEVDRDDGTEFKITF